MSNRFIVVSFSQNNTVFRPLEGGLDFTLNCGIPLARGDVFDFEIVEGTDPNAQLVGKLIECSELTTQFEHKVENYSYHWRFVRTDITKWCKVRLVSGTDYSLFIRPVAC